MVTVFINKNARKLREKLVPVLQGKTGCRVDPRYYRNLNDMSMSRILSDSESMELMDPITGRTPSSCIEMLNPSQVLQLSQMSRSMTQETSIEGLAPLARADSFEDLQTVQEEELSDQDVEHTPSSSQQNGSIFKSSFLLLPQFRLKKPKKKLSDYFKRNGKKKRVRKMSSAMMRDALINRVGIRSVFLSDKNQMEHWSVIDRDYILIY